MSIERDIATGAWISPDLSGTTLADWATTWVATRKHLKPSTQASTLSLLDSRVLPVFGEMPLGRIQAHDVEVWIAEMVDDYL